MVEFVFFCINAFKLVNKCLEGMSQCQRRLPIYKDLFTKFFINLLSLTLHRYQAMTPFMEIFNPKVILK